MPEFVPFSNNVSPRKSHQSTNNNSNPTQSCSDRRIPTAYRDADKISESHTSAERCKRRHDHFENGDRRDRVSRDSERSVYREDRSRRNQVSPRRSSERKRSRSPSRQTQNEAQRKRDTSFQRTTERLSIERHRQVGSVFERMENPPTPRRPPRRSADSNGHVTQIVRTVSNHYEQIEPNYRSTTLQMETVDFGSLQVLTAPYQRRRSPIRFVDQQSIAIEPSHIPDVTLSSRSVLVHDSAELHDLKNRIISTQNHCIGLEQTVHNYQREIFKLKKIVENLVEDFIAISNNRDF